MLQCVIFWGKLIILKQHNGYFVMDLASLSPSQMARAIPRQAPPSRGFRATLGAGDLTCIRVGMPQAHKHSGSLTESRFGPGTLWPQGRDFTSRPPRPRY
ncbi:hypothetical protein AVEN_259999-1 [Araneus ventricosus]|uniref:Uncharacterized protein n=1 Tax=Araneus ventricosus TaxID=182803 RepID=A0A4Y2H4E8_ARAVE|nr:hypothetical protein AVEN_259999-1 [Araneus ventricosus]